MMINRKEISKKEKLVMQNKKAYILQFMMNVAQICNAVILMGIIGFIVILWLTPSTIQIRDDLKIAYQLMPLAYTMALYLIICVGVTFYTRKAVVDRASSAFVLTIIYILLLLPMIPVGSLFGLCTVAMLPPRKWRSSSLT